MFLIVTDSESVKFVVYQLLVMLAFTSLDGPGIPNSPTQSYEGKTLKLHCVIDANPAVSTKQASWTRSNYEMTRTTVTISSSPGNLRTLTLVIKNVVRQDIGKFTCEANNTYGVTSKEYTVTPVACKWKWLFNNSNTFSCSQLLIILMLHTHQCQWNTNFQYNNIIY